MNSTKPTKIFGSVGAWKSPDLGWFGDRKKRKEEIESAK